MREIIDVPVAETVVRLGDAEDALKREGVVRDFVLTRQVERNLKVISQSIKEGSGRGHFLIGAYGSGKSHFLSYASLILSGSVRSRGDGCPLSAAVSGRRLLPVRVSLVRVRNDMRLEDAFLAEAERSLKDIGSRACVSRRSRFLNHVDAAIRPVDSARMEGYLAKNGFPAWDELKKTPDRAVVAAWGYSKTLEGCPVMPEMPPAELVEEIVAWSKEAGFEGVFVVIDELSEFLRSKPSPQALSDDARYLQLIGELAGRLPVWIVASLQEAIERSGDISRDVIVKIKDRYPVTLSLDENHIRELIDGRLVKKKEGARERIREVWQRYTECLPNFGVDFESFFRIYPVHPATIGYLEGLRPIFSAHRGVVDFIVTSVRGDGGQKSPGVMDEKADRLVTADLIYNHFRDRIMADNRYADFDAIVRRDLNRAIDKVFADESDRLLARRAVDLLILNEISELEKPKTVSELAEILLVAVTDVSAGANVEYLSEVILKALLKESLFLRCEPAASAGDCVFRVALERDQRGLFDKEAGRVLLGVGPDDTRILRVVMDSVPAVFPVREMREKKGHEICIQWRGTPRRGRLFLSEDLSPAEIQLALESEDASFAVVVVPAGFAPACGESFPPSSLLWSPRFGEGELGEMRKFYAAVILANDEAGGIERAVREEAARFVEAEKLQIAKVVESGYRNGRFLFASGKECNAVSYHGAHGFLDKCLSGPVISLLSSLHPKFQEVAPVVEFVSRRALAPTVDAILAPGKITMSAARKNNTRMMIEGVLVPLGIARVHGPSYVMQLDPGKSALVRDVMDAIGACADSKKLVHQLKTGPWGLSGEMAALLIAAMVRGGLVEIKKDGRRIPSAIVNLSHVDEADEIYAGELLEPGLRERLFADAGLSRGMDAALFSLSSQREAWERLLSFRDRLRADVGEIMPKLAVISEYPVFDSFDFERVRRILEQGVDAVAGVEDSQGSSKGLARYLSADRPNMVELSREILAIKEFVMNGAEKVIRIADYLGDIPSADVLPEEIAGSLSELKLPLSRLTDVILGGQMAYIFAAYDRFFELYSEWYVEEHRRAFAHNRFSEFEKIREAPAYLALKAADTVSGIHLADGAAQADRHIDQMLSARCTRSPSAELRLKGRCACGFTPGDLRIAGDAGKVLEGVQAGIAEAIAALSEPAVLEKIVARISALRDIDVKKAEGLESFLHRMRVGIAPGAFVSLMTPEMASLLNEALHRRVSVVTRDLNSLVEKISGRRLPPERLRKIFDEWLGHYDSGDVVIEVASGGDKGGTVEEALVAWIKDHGLDDSAARLSLVIPSDVGAEAGAGIFEDVGDERLKRMGELAGLGVMSGEECLNVLARERRFPQFAWDVAKRIANHLVDGWRPLADAEIACHFPDVANWVRSAAAATAPFNERPLESLVRAESGRDAAIALIEEHLHLKNFPSPQIVGRLKDAAQGEAASRDRVFASLDARGPDFAGVFEKWPDAVFLFVDAARWDLISHFDAIIQKIAGLGIAKELWYKNPDASTAGFQRLFFGTDDADAIRSMMQHRGVRYAGSIERADARARLIEEAGEGALWLNAGFIDRALHSTRLPLHRLVDELAREFEEMMAGVSRLLNGRTLILASDHGFSEVSSRDARYGHDASRVSDTVAAMIVYGATVKAQNFASKIGL